MARNMGKRSRAKKIDLAYSIMNYLEDYNYV